MAGADYPLAALLHAFNQAADAIAPEQENRELRGVGGYFMLLGLLNTRASYHAMTNPPPILNYMPVMIPFIVQCFTLGSGIIIMAIGWLLLVGHNPRQHSRLVRIGVFLLFIATAFNLGMVL